MSPNSDRNQMRVRVLRQEDQADGADVAALTPGERLGMMWQLARDAWTFKGEPERAESRLQRDALRVQRGKR
jgi:hypothetical protein